MRMSISSNIVSQKPLFVPCVSNLYRTTFHLKVCCEMFPSLETRVPKSYHPVISHEGQFSYSTRSESVLLRYSNVFTCLILTAPNRIPNASVGSSFSRFSINFQLVFNRLFCNHVHMCSCLGFSLPLRPRSLPKSGGESVLMVISHTASPSHSG